ncbi:MAG: hypothetical protein V2A66_05480 [Pseudomonadota bacterium]
MKLLRWMVVSVCLMALWSCRGNSTILPKDEKNDVLKSLSSENWVDRNKGLITLLRNENSGEKINRETADVLVRMLDREVEEKGKSGDKIINKENDSHSSGLYGDYVTSLATAVASNKIEGGLPVLFKFLLSTSYTISPAILTAYGEPALELLIDRIENGNKNEKELALRVLSIWVAPSSDADDYDETSMPRLTKLEMQKAMPIFLKFAKDPVDEIRYTAISGLGPFLYDPNILQAMQIISTSDSEKAIRSKAKRIIDAYQKK